MPNICLYFKHIALNVATIAKKRCPTFNWTPLVTYLSTLEQVASVDVEGTLAILILDEGVFAELANGQALLKGYDEVLVHDEAQTATNGDMWAVSLCALCHICIILCTILLITAERHIATLSNHSTVRECTQAEGDVLLPECERHETPAQLSII